MNEEHILSPEAPEVEEPVATEQSEPRHVRGHKSLWREVLEILLLTLVLFLVAHFSVQNFKVSGVSMYPTLQDNEYILVDKVSYRFHTPNHGDIIVFVYPGDRTQDYIKRVIGVPGDKVAVEPVTEHSGKTTQVVYRTFVNGRMLDEPYVNPQAPMVSPYPVDSCVTAQKCQPFVVPPGKLFVMGDNRGNSYDSRAWGVLSFSDVIGRAMISYWPLSQLAFIPSQFSYATTTASSK